MRTGQWAQFNMPWIWLLVPMAIKQQMMVRPQLKFGLNKLVNFGKIAKQSIHIFTIPLSLLISKNKDTSAQKLLDLSNMLLFFLSITYTKQLIEVLMVN